MVSFFGNAVVAGAGEGCGSVDSDTFTLAVSFREKNQARKRRRQDKPFLCLAPALCIATVGQLCPTFLRRSYRPRLDAFVGVRLIRGLSVTSPSTGSPSRDPMISSSGGSMMSYRILAFSSPWPTRFDPA